ESIYVQPYSSTSSVVLPLNYSIGGPVPDNPYNPVSSNYLIVSDQSLSGGGNVYLGGDPAKQTTTVNILIVNGSNIQAPLISLLANKTIEVQGGAQLVATSPNSTGMIEVTTSGSAVIDAGATLHANHTFAFNTASLTINGTLSVDSGAMTLESSNIYLGGSSPVTSGLYVSQSLWNNFAATAADITLLSNNAINFQDSFGLWAKDKLTLDAGEFVNSPGNNGNQVVLAAPTVNLMNSGASSQDSPAKPGTGNISAFSVGTYTVAGSGATYTTNNIAVGGSGAASASNDVLFSGFGQINLNSAGDVTMVGKGSLTTGGALLNISAARVATAGLVSGSDNVAYNTAQTNNVSYVAPDFHVYTGSNYHNDVVVNSSSAPSASITISGSGGTASTASAPGGVLEFWGTSINVGATTDSNGNTVNAPVTIQSDGGTIRLNAMGSKSSDNSIHLYSGSQI